MFLILSYKSYLYSHIACSCDKNNLESIQRKNHFLFLCMKFGVCDTFMLSAVCFTILLKMLLLLFLCVTFLFYTEIHKWKKEQKEKANKICNQSESYSKGERTKTKHSSLIFWNSVWNSQFWQFGILSST